MTRLWTATSLHPVAWRTAKKLPGTDAPEAPAGVKLMTSSSLTVWLTKVDGAPANSCPAAAPAAVIAKVPIDEPLTATVTVQSAVVIVPPVTPPNLTMRPRNAARAKAAIGEAPIEAEWHPTCVSFSVG